MTCRRIPGQNFYRTDWNKRAFTVGIHGPIGSGKTTIILAVCSVLKDHNICVVTNDFYTTVDADKLVESGAIPKEKIRSVITEGCPLDSMNKNIDGNLKAIKELTEEFQPEIILLESAGDCHAAHFNRDLVDYTILIIDIAGGENIIKKRIAGNDYCELLVVNKIDLEKALEFNMEDFKMAVIMTRMDRSLLFTSAKNPKDMSAIAECIVRDCHEKKNQIPPECP